MKEIVQAIRSYFDQEEYQHIETDLSDVVMYAVMYDEYLYLINIIALGEDTAFDIDKFQGYKGMVEKQFAFLDSDKIVLLNIILCEYPNLYYHSFNYLPDLNKPLIDIHWLIDIKKRKLIIPKKQIKTLIGIDKELRDILKFKLSKRKIKMPKIPKLTGGIIGINILVWVCSLFLNGSMVEKAEWLGANMSRLVIDHYQLWRIVTSLFVHLRWSQLVFAVALIAFLAPPIERVFKWYDFVILYLFAGIVGNSAVIIESLITGEQLVNISALPAIFGLIGGGFAFAKHQYKKARNERIIFMGILFVLGMLNTMINSGLRNSANFIGFGAGFLVCSVMLRQYLILEAKYEGHKA